jgi:hypothetical protein
MAGDSVLAAEVNLLFSAVPPPIPDGNQIPVSMKYRLAKYTMLLILGPSTNGVHQVLHSL